MEEEERNKTLINNLIKNSVFVFSKNGKHFFYKYCIPKTL